MWHDWCRCTHFTIDVDSAQLSILMLTLYERCGMIDLDARILRLVWLMLNDQFWCSCFANDVAASRCMHLLSMCPMLNDRFWCLRFDNDAAWLTWMHAFHDWCGWCTMIDSDACTVRLMRPTLDDWHRHALNDWFGQCPITNACAFRSMWLMRDQFGLTQLITLHNMTLH
jgi:hypothetical protein